MHEIEVAQRCMKGDDSVSENRHCWGHAINQQVKVVQSGVVWCGVMRGRSLGPYIHLRRRKSPGRPGLSQIGDV